MALGVGRRDARCRKAGRLAPLWGNPRGGWALLAALLSQVAGLTAALVLIVGLVTLWRRTYPDGPPDLL